MTLALTLLLAGTLAPSVPHVVAVRAEAIGGRQAVRVMADRPLAAVTVRREGSAVVLGVEGEPRPDLEAPAASAPIETIQLSPSAGTVDVRVTVPSGTPYEVRRESSELVVLFGQPRAREMPTPAADVAELYRRLFPAPVDPTSAAGEDEAGGQVVATGSEVPKPHADGDSGLLLGPVTLRPSAAVTYVDADTTLLSESATPVHDSYLELQPRLAAEMSLLAGRLQADYEPKFRAYSAFEEVRRPSHFANAQLELPVGPRFILGATEHYARGTLETNEVDPGGEYFFRLGRFTHNAAAVTGKMSIGPRLGLDLRAGYSSVDVADSSSFLSYDTATALAGVSLDATPSVRAVLAYVYERVPPPAARPEVESTAHSLDLMLTGEVMPLLTADVTVGYRHQSDPQAGAGGRTYSGLALAATLNREFSRAARLSLSADHMTHVSAFEENGFYVTTATEAALTVPLPAAFSLRGAAGYHWNDYQTISPQIDALRRDRIFGWSIGLGRPLSRWAYARVDYRRDHRTSNLPGFEANTDGLMIQIGLGTPGGERP